MFEQLLDQASHIFDEHERARLIRELASYPDEMLEILIRTAGHPPAIRQEVAIQTIHAIGYPRNASAVPLLVRYIGEPNRLGWDEAVQALTEMDTEMVLPYLIQELWDRGQTNRSWAPDVEGICLMLANDGRKFASSCGPVITYILSHQDVGDDLDKGFLLAALEEIGQECAVYALPTLIDLVSRTGTSELGKQARALIASFDEEALEPYQLLLTTMEEQQRD